MGCVGVYSFALVSEAEPLFLYSKIMLFCENAKKICKKIKKRGGDFSPKTHIMNVCPPSIKVLIKTPHYI